MKTRKIKILKQFPQHLKCPFCGTNKSAKTLLIPVIAKNCEVHTIIPIHKHCILNNLVYDQQENIFFALPRTVPGK